jgi:hypothetical protein
VIVDNLDIGRPRRTWWPFEANPPLIIDADAVLPGSVTPQSFQTVAGQRAKIGEALRSFQSVEPSFRLPGKTGEFTDVFAGSEAFGAPVSIPNDHNTCTDNYELRKA